MKYDDKNIKIAVIEGLKKNYSIIPALTEFIPVGEESYTYSVTSSNKSKYFVKYCEKKSIIKNIDSVNKLLTELHNFNFVVPPIISNEETTFKLIKGNIYVYPYIEGEIITVGNEEIEKEVVNQLLEIVVQIHTFKNKMGLNLPVENLKNNFLNDFNKIWEIFINNKNNISVDVVSLLISSEKLVRTLINEQTETGDFYTKNKPNLVLTHGDITGRNIIRATSGLKLVDWDGAMFAPAERDLNFLIDNPNFSLNEYLGKVKVESYDPKLKKYYSLQWAIKSILDNFEKLMTLNLTDSDRKEYIDEAKEYLGYYQ